MTIPFEKIKTRLLANPQVSAEYDALAPEFEIARQISRASPHGMDGSSASSANPLRPPR